MPDTATRVETMTDAELDANLTALYRQHRDADGPGRKSVIHGCIVDIIGEQKRRLDEWLDGR